jgi:hypothetical protein
MPNIYATPTEVKAASPDITQATTTKYDALIMRLCNTVSRQIDQITGREFYPELDTKTMTPEVEDAGLRIPDLLSLTSAAYSSDGINYSTISSAYIVPNVEGDRNGERSYTHLRLLYNAPVWGWPAIEDGAQVTGVWAYHDSRDDAWELAGTLSSTCSAVAVSLSINDISSDSMWTLDEAFTPGLVIKIDSEFMEITKTSISSVIVKRARNGTTAAVHASAASIYVWHPCDLVKQAVIIEVIKLLERGLQGFANARSTPEMGQPIWEKKIDVQTLKMLEPLMRI